MKLHKGHYGKYTGNAKWSMNHAHTPVTKENYKARSSSRPKNRLRQSFAKRKYRKKKN